MLASPMDVAATLEAAVDLPIVRLSHARPGDAGVIVQVHVESRPGDHGVGVDELERRLLEFGFVEGAIRKDPIAVRIDDMRVALRRRDAEDVLIRLEEGPKAGRRRSR